MSNNENARTDAFQVDEETGEVIVDGQESFSEETLSDDAPTDDATGEIVGFSLHLPYLLARFEKSGTLSKYVHPIKTKERDRYGKYVDKTFYILSAQATDDISTFLGISVIDTKVERHDDRYTAISQAVMIPPHGVEVSRFGGAEQPLKDKNGKDDPYAFAKVVTKAQRNAQNHLIPTPFKARLIASYKRAQTEHNGRGSRAAKPSQKATGKQRKSDASVNDGYSKETLDARPSKRAETRAARRNGESRAARADSAAKSARATVDLQTRA